MDDVQSRLTKAIGDERKAHEEYKNLAQQVSGPDRETLLAMAADEHRHQESLERMLEHKPGR